MALGMPVNSNIPSLNQLRAHGFGSPGKPSTLWQNAQNRPWYQHKVYSEKEPWLYRPTRHWKGTEYLPIAEQLLPSTEVAKLVNQRPLKKLVQEAEESLRQILYHAHRGDERAVRIFATTVRQAVNSLENLAVSQKEKVQSVAIEEPRWPVLISLNPKDINLAKDYVENLHVGEKAITPTKAGQRVDRRNFWTKLAFWATNECEITKHCVPILRYYADNSNAKPSRIEQKIWATPVKATVYRLGEDVIVIADWEEQCAGLSRPITRENFENWWRAVRGFVMEYWNSVPAAYRAALKEIGAGTGRVKKNNSKDQRRYKEDRQRNLAFGSVRQALKSLAGVR